MTNNEKLAEWLEKRLERSLAMDYWIVMELEALLKSLKN
jgi:hypothetical protein